MRACVLSAAALFVAAPAAQASVITVGGNYATSCYRAAENRINDLASWRACDNALALEPLGDSDRAGTFVNRAILHMLAGRTPRAIDDLAAAERLDPRQPEIYLNQAIIAYQAGRKASARDLASRALDLHTRKPAFALFLRGVAHEDLGSIKAAYADLSRAAQLAPSWAEPKKELARYRVR